MKKLSLVLMMAVALFSCDNDDDVKVKSNEEKVVEFLKSIETGATEPIAYVNAEAYTQHNQGVADGLEGFGALLSALPEGGAKVNTVRVFKDGDYVVAHSEWDFFGPKAGFDIFKFENGLIVEHWDNLQDIVAETVSGRTQFDGVTQVTDLDKTEVNKQLVTSFVNDVLLGNKADYVLTDYISADKYYQHNPGVADGIDGLVAALTALAEAGMPMVYSENHIILGQGNFVLAVSEGTFLNKHVSYYDLFRVEGGKIVEHWDVIENFIPAEQVMNTNGKFNF